MLSTASVTFEFWDLCLWASIARGLLDSELAHPSRVCIPWLSQHYAFLISSWCWTRKLLVDAIIPGSYDKWWRKGPDDDIVVAFTIFEILFRGRLSPICCAHGTMIKNDTTVTKNYQIIYNLRLDFELALSFAPREAAQTSRCSSSFKLLLLIVTSAWLGPEAVY